MIWLRQNGRWLCLILILLLATWLRFHMLGAQSFWNDEGNSARLSERSLQLIIEGTASDIHPPLYYLLLRGWRELLGESEFGLRALSAFSGVLILPAGYALGRRLLRSESAGLATAVFLAINPALVYYSQEARMYALLGLWAVLSTVLLLRWQKRPYFIIGLLYVTISALGLYTHYFYPAVLLTHNLFMLVKLWPALRRLDWHNGRLRGWVGMMLATLAVYAPWLPIFLVQFSDDPVNRPALWTFLRGVSHWLFFGETMPPGAVEWPWIVVALLVVGGLLTAVRRLWLPMVGIGVALGLMIVPGTMDDPYFKFLTIILPLVGVLLVGMIAQPGRWRWVGWGLLLLLLPANGRSLNNLYYDPAYARADYRGMAQRIVEEAHPNAGIILNAPNQWEAFTYYYRDDTAVYPLPRGRTQPTEDQIDAALAPIAQTHDRIYAIFWGEAQRDPERLVERWLDANAFKATDEWVGDVRFVTYAVPEAPATEMETSLGILFGEAITLQGYTLNQVESWQPGEIVQLTLFWQTAVPLETRYKIFLHIVDEAGRIVAQRDSEPGGGLAITTEWELGAVVVDNHGILLPPTLENGRYALRMGLYDAFNPNDRLLIQLDGTIQDSLLITTWELDGATP